MKISTVLTVSLAVTLSGCAVFDALVNLATEVDRSLAGQPDIYVARRFVSEFGDTSYIIDRITVARGRDGAPPEIEFEGSHQDFAQLGGARFNGNFIQMRQRADGARLAGTAEENIGDTLEYHAFIYGTPSGRVVMDRTDNAFAEDAFDLCFSASDYRADLNRYLLENALIEPRDIDVIEVEWDWAASGGKLGEFQVLFGGWATDGHAAFDVLVAYSATVTLGDRNLLEPGEFMRTPANGRFAERVVYSANNGRPLRCAPDERLAPASESVFDVRLSRVGLSQGIDILPPDGEIYPLYLIPTGELFFLPEPIDILLAPVQP